MRTRWSVLAAAAAALAVLPAVAQGRVTTAQSVLATGESGFVPVTGSNPRLGDQIPLFESFTLKPAGFDLPATSTQSPRAGVTITRDAYGVPDVHAGDDPDLWFGVGYAVRQDKLRGP